MLHRHDIRYHSYAQFWSSPSSRVEVQLQLNSREETREDSSSSFELKNPNSTRLVSHVCTPSASSRLRFLLDLTFLTPSSRNHPQRHEFSVLRLNSTYSKPCLAMNTFIIEDSKDMYNTIHTSQITSPTLQRIHRHFEETRKHQIMQRNLINDHLSYYHMASFIFDEQSLLVQSMAHL